MMMTTRRWILRFTLAVVAGVLSQVPATTSGQSPAGTANRAAVAASKPAPAAAARTLRTPWGEPDLQGIWNSAYQIPLQRPAQYEGREFLTDAEIAEIDRKREALERREHRAGAGTEQDVAGAYNAVFESHRKTGRRTSLVVDPPDGRIPAMTPAATKRLEMERAFQANPRTAPNPGTWNTGRMNRADGPEDRSTAERCLGSMLPDLNAFVRIVQSPGSVAIYYEHGQGGGGNRIIPTNNSPHLPSNIRPWYGDARGRWEGDTLVVDTTNFSPKTFYRAAHENLHLIERFRRTDANTLVYEVRVEDATTWTRPWTVRMDMQKNDDKFNRIFESTCHEGNYGLTGMLANTRAAERLFAEGKGPDPTTMNLAIGGAGGEADPFEGGAE